MPRGKFTNHKGRNRRFTNPEELEEERRKEEQKKKWRQQHGDISSESEEEEAAKKDSEGSSDESEEESSSDDESVQYKVPKVRSDESEEESSSDDESKKAKGVSNLIEIENPNRVQKKTKKLATLNTVDLDSSKPQLSRREREEIEKQKAQAHYQKLHAEGKTDQARADLARLAIIKQQREEAKKKREAEIKEKEDAAKQKTAQTQKALGKK